VDNHDVNHDIRIDSADVDFLVRNLLRTTYGDANFDGVFNSSDLVLVFQAGRIHRCNPCLPERG
jgi:hypothetical protein